MTPFDEATDEEMADIAAHCRMGDEAAINAMVQAYEADGRSKQEVEIMLFLWVHDQEQVSMAQAECLQYLWNDGKLH